MYCKHCGSPVADESKFCPNCGNSLMEDVPVEESFAAQEEPVAQEETFETYSEVTEEPTTAETIPMEEEISPEESIPPYTPQEPTFQYNDPFTGPAHPSVKKNIIIACVAVGIATIISIILMVVGMVSISKNGAWEEAFTEMDAYEESMITEDESADDNAPADIPVVDLGESGNTVGNILNGSYVIDAGAKGIFYADNNNLFYRDSTNELFLLASSDTHYYSWLNLAGNQLYYTLINESGIPEKLLCLDLTTETETEIMSFEESVYYLSIFKNDLYYSTDYNIYAMDLTTKGVRTIYESAVPIYEVFVTDKGIYYIDETEYGLYYLNRIGHDGSSEKMIEESYLYSYDNGFLYSNCTDYSGCDNIYVSEEDNIDFGPQIYRFEENTYVAYMNIRNGILYCITETEESPENYSYAVRIIDMANEEEIIIDETTSADENPYFGLSVAGKYLFYYDMNYSYGLRVHELPM